ncbi:DUF4168 domain-containing protein [Salinimicrobium gaetbulicola]|uniref:DUF4168 domain-containing protein n=1 Tax=Salinimicrobium gaetbulicola TaxID=999702 RepID=A0ABW3IDI6_9FLAO
MCIRKIAGSLLIFILFSTPLLAQNDLPEISDSELEKFSKVFRDLRALDKEIQKNMIDIVSEEKMEIQRFNELYKQDLDPKQKLNLSEEEEIKYTRIVEEIENMQIDFQKDIEETLRNVGLSVEKYQQIATRVQIDAHLQKRLRKSIND